MLQNLYLGTELIIRAAKVVQTKAKSEWARYGVSDATVTFAAA